MSVAEDRLKSAVESVCRLVSADPAQNWTLDAFREETGVPKSTFQSAFRRLVGKTPMEYLRDQRMNLACELLGDGRQSIATVAERVGYQSVSAFGVTFRRWAGCSPSAFRRDHLKVIRLKFPDQFAQ